MRLSTSQIFQQAVTAMQSRQADLSRTQLQLAKGQKILAPSDDPAASTRILSLEKAIETGKQYQRNADVASSRLSLEETTLSNVGDLLQRVRELSVRANNATLSAGDRKAIAAEVGTSIDALVQLANSQDENGEYLFSGFKTGTIPFTDNGSGNFSYDGDQGQRHLQIGARRTVPVGDPGADVFMKIDNGSGGTTSMFAVLYDFKTDLEANSPSTTTISQLDSAIDSVLNTRAAIGARMNTIDGQKNANESLSIVLKQNRSELKDLDYAEAVSQFQQQLLALQASQQTFVKTEGLSLFNYL